MSEYANGIKTANLGLALTEHYVNVKSPMRKGNFQKLPPLPEELLICHSSHSSASFLFLHH